MSYIGTPTYTPDSDSPTAYTYSCTAFPGQNGYLQFDTTSAGSPWMHGYFPNAFDASNASKLKLTFTIPKAGNWAGVWPYAATYKWNEWGDVGYTVTTDVLEKTMIEMDISAYTTMYFSFRFRQGDAQTGQFRIYSLVLE